MPIFELLGVIKICTKKSVKRSWLTIWSFELETGLTCFVLCCWRLAFKLLALATFWAPSVFKNGVSTKTGKNFEKQGRKMRKNDGLVPRELAVFTFFFFLRPIWLLFILFYSFYQALALQNRTTSCRPQHFRFIDRGATTVFNYSPQNHLSSYFAVAA